MTLFQSVGSNYRARDVWRHVFSVGGHKQSKALAEQLTKRFDGQSALIFHTGRAALSEAVRVLTGGKGAVVVNAFTCSVVVDAVRTAGCEVAYLDIEADSLHFDAPALASLLTERSDISAVIVQNSLGIPVDISAIEKLTRQHQLPLIEDIAHAVGGKYSDGRVIGTVGAATALSFGRDKMLDTINGGALVWRTDQFQLEPEPPTKLPGPVTRLRDRFYPLIALIARGLFPLGLGGVVIRLSYVLKLAVRSADAPVDRRLTMPGWQARLAGRQIDELDKIVDKRRVAAGRYHLLQDFMPTRPTSSAVRVPLLVANPAEVLQALKQNKFYFEDIWYDVPVAPARLYDKQDFPEEDNPVSTQLTKQIINLPTHDLVSDQQAAQIVRIVQEVARVWK